VQEAQPHSRIRESLSTTQFEGSYTKIRFSASNAANDD
jgi:hypothetical protein